MNIQITNEAEAFYLFKHCMISFEVLKSAIEISLFNFLNKDFQPIYSIKKNLNLQIDDRNLYDFLDKLLTMNLLERKLIDNSFVYKNTDSTNKLFTSESKENIINGLLIYKEVQKKFQGLTDILKSNQLKERNIFSEFEDFSKLENYLLSNVDFGRKKFNNFAENFVEIKQYKIITDIGGGLGALSQELKKKYNDKIYNTYDLLIIEPMVQKFLFNNKNINIKSGDFLINELPKSDCFLLSNVMCGLNYESKKKLIKKLYDSLNSNGVLCIIEPLINNDRSIFCPAIDLSLVMLIYYYKGYHMTLEELENMGLNVGFIKVEFIKTETIEYTILRK